jgi:hypothetical protein
LLREVNNRYIIPPGNQLLPNLGDWPQHIIDDVVSLLQSTIFDLLRTDDGDTEGIAVFFIEFLYLEVTWRGADLAAAPVFVWFQYLG